MIISLLIILVVFITLLVAIWFWYATNERAIHQKLYALGVKAACKNDFKRAKALLSQAITLKSNFKEARCELCLVYSKEKDFESSKECFENALKMAPKDFDTLFHFANILKIQNAYEEAKNLYLRALKEDSKNRDCHFNLGYINFYQKDYPTALEFFKKVLELSPEDADAQFYIIRCKDEMCTYEEGEDGKDIIDEYLKISQNPNLPAEFYLSFAKAYAKTGQIDEALKQCQSGLIKDSENVDGYNLLGLIQLLKKDFSGAKNNLSTVINLQSDNEEAHELLSYVFCQQRNRCALSKCRAKYQELVNKFINTKSSE